MHPFIQAASVAGGVGAAIVASVILLTHFHRALAWISGSGKTSTIAVQGVLQNDTLATVHVDGQEPLERVRLVGVTNTHLTDTHVSWEGRLGHSRRRIPDAVSGEGVGHQDDLCARWQVAQCLVSQAEVCVRDQHSATNGTS
jgi:hypothetical protein